VFRQTGYKFKMPYDTCKVCDEFTKIWFSEGNERTKLDEELKLHQDAAGRAYKAKSNKERSKNDPEYGDVFNMQQCLPNDDLTFNTVFY
jgi:hypothetical protein